MLHVQVSPKLTYTFVVFFQQNFTQWFITLLYIVRNPFWTFCQWWKFISFPLQITEIDIRCQLQYMCTWWYFKWALLSSRVDNKAQVGRFFKLDKIAFASKCRRLPCHQRPPTFLTNIWKEAVIFENYANYLINMCGVCPKSNQVM